jgi:hypothetical protein
MPAPSPVSRIGARGAPVLEIRERLDRHQHHVIARLVVQASNDGDAASIVLVAGVVEAIGLLMLAGPDHL